MLLIDMTSYVDLRPRAGRREFLRFLEEASIGGVRVGDYASIMRTIMKTIMSPLFEPETPPKCFFEARGDVAFPNEAGGIIVEAIIVPIIAHNRSHNRS